MTPNDRTISIISPTKDFLFFFLSSAVVFLVWLASSVFHIDGFTILAVVAVSANAPHLVSTWTRAYFDTRTLKEKPLALIALPLVIFAIILTLTFKFEVVGTKIINSTILYWATWHFVAQNWGILRIYQRKSGEDLNSWAMKMERPLLMISVLFCLAHRIYTGPRMLFGVEVFYLALPYNLVLALLAPIAALLGFIVTVRLRQKKESFNRSSWIRLAFIATSFIGFFVPFQMITTDDTSAFAAAACWHAIQYLGIVKHHNMNTFRAGIEPKAKIISWLSQPGYKRAILYFAFLWALAGSVYGVILLFSFVTKHDFYVWAGIIWVTLTLSHYLVDGFIWKLRRTELSARLGIL
jgi:hypothetical protein